MEQENKTFAEMKAEMQAEQPELVSSDFDSAERNGYDFESCKKYPIDVLSERDPEKLPKDVNPAHKEVRHETGVPLFRKI